MDTDSDGFGPAPAEDPYGSASECSDHFIQPTPKSKAVPKQQIDESTFQNARLLVTRGASVPLLPWERGFAAKVLGTAPNRLWPFTDPPLKAAVQQDSQVQGARDKSSGQLRLPTCVSSTAYKRVRFAKRVETPDALREAAITKWRMLMEADLESTTAGQQILTLAEHLAPETEITEMLENIFSGKKTATLVKRINSMLHYLAWARQGMKFRPLLCDEEVVYGYLVHLARSGAAPTKGASFVQSLSFYRHLLGCAAADAALQSQRVRGASVRQAKRKRALKQATILKLFQCRILENLVSNAPFDPDRVAAGFFMFCLMSSSRNYDANRAEYADIQVDDDGTMTIELGTLDHKTATTVAKQTTFLPLIAMSPALIRDQPEGWGQAWIAARERCGLSFGKSKPVLPALGTDGVFLQRPATSAECSSWLTELVRMGGDPQAHLTTHALKATLLAWCAAYGVPLEDRRLLGHHSHPTEKSVLTYSRQAMIGPLAMVHNMFLEIEAGTFDPEASRMKLIQSRAQHPEKKRNIVHATRVDIPNPAQEEVFPWPICDPGDSTELGQELEAEGGMERDDGRHESASSSFDCSGWDMVSFEQTELNSPSELEDNEQTISSSDSSSTGSNESSDLDDEDLPDIALNDELVLKAGLDASPVDYSVLGFDTFQHRTSGAVHYRRTAEMHKLLCSRIITNMYAKIDTPLQFQWPVCHQCKHKL